MKSTTIFGFIFLFAVFSTASFGAENETVPAKPTARRSLTIEGWTVRVDERLFDEENREIGKKALKMIDWQLFRISEIFPPERLEQLRRVPIVLDLTHGKLGSCQYHPSREWLLENGYDAELTQCVHLPTVAFFVDKQVQRDQPCVLLHELAHAYHDQVLGFDNPTVVELWKKTVDTKKYESTLHINGSRTRHYALTNPQEFFAETTETLFGQNDFYPFVAGELQEAEPEIYDAIRALWLNPQPNADAKNE